MKISIASGKGGTGKTTLALLLAAAHPHSTLIDCDVEEPNCHLFLQPAWQAPPSNVYITIPHIDTHACQGCGICATLCRFNAIALVNKKAMLFDELCHGCGCCQLACPQQAIREQNKSIGTMQQGTATTVDKTQLIQGTLQLGLPSAVPLIKKVLQTVGRTINSSLYIIDGPPGTSCAMVSAVSHSDYCILVTEPTPFGLHDLRLALRVTHLLAVPTGVVINKSDGANGDVSIQEACQQEAVPLLGKIPHSVSFAKDYAAGYISPVFVDVIHDIWRQIQQQKGSLS